MSSRTAQVGWLRGPLWDISCLALGWVPFYLWLLGTPLTRPGQEAGPSLAVALIIALGLNFLHRHYVFLLVYGDRASFGERPRAYVAAPVLAFVIVATSLLCSLPNGKEALLVALGSWNVWHVMQQRYGLLRAYAARAGLTAIIVEQDVGVAQQVSSRLYCLQEGRVTLTGASRELSREQISQAYFGEAGTRDEAGTRGEAGARDEAGTRDEAGARV